MNISKNDTVLDVGGHYGFFSLYALNQGAKTVHVVEPTHENFKIFMQKFKRI